jgi:hypothetical protein
LQNYLRPIIAHAREIKEGLQPEVLRQEMLKLDKQSHAAVSASEDKLLKVTK